MCGLIGVAGPAADMDAYGGIKAMLGRVRHRGPDGQGAAVRDDLVIGHTRLAVRDLSTAGAQPWQTTDIVLSYNGELWNADQLDTGQLDTSCDTEVFARKLQQYGDKALGLFDGMFAAAWLDRRDGLLRLARDCWGRVPLYWTSDLTGFYWASEYGALPYGQAHDVKPGHVMTVDPASGAVLEDHPFSDGQWWPTQFDIYPETVRHLLAKGVRERLVSDRSIAFLLSGGLDSSLILALAAEQYTGRVVAYTAVLDPSSADLVASRRVAAHFDVELVEVPVPVPDAARITKAVHTVEIPMKAQVEIALAHMPVMEQIARDGHAVCLSGEAADELFGGYGNMQIAASRGGDNEYRAIKLAAVEKMARGNFPRVNKVGMQYGVECRLPFMQAQLVELALGATRAESPPGKRLLKEAARGLVPDWVISRPKATFQGGVGTAAAVATLYDSPAKHYNQTARRLFGFLPRS